MTPSKERGAALIIVLGLVALIGTWASTAAYEDMISLRRAENMQDAMRGLQGSQSVLALSVKALRQDALDSTTDDLEEQWAQMAPPFPIDQGLVSGVIVDSNRFLNLNDLVNAQGVLQVAVLTRLQALFVRLELDPGLVAVLADWMDGDDLPIGASGAEDSAYYDQPYRVKNGRLQRWQELAMLKGFDAKVIKKLSEVATVRVVPQGGSTPVNINTASAMVLQTLFPDMSSSDAEGFMANRPYTDVATAIANQPWAAANSGVNLSVTSNMFKLRSEARFGRAILREEYVLLRMGNKMSLLSRQRLGWMD
ncbi:MAG: type II secretion system minor pseudopilin GspK [Mariprofundus sp.]|nr:type II secretion system minor pseudopilin GspK [Mariprofundus sp.]